MWLRSNTMSFFGRKEIAKLKKELEASDKQIKILQSEVAQLTEKSNRYLTALNQANRVVDKYKAECSRSNTPTADTSSEDLARLKEKDAVCEKKLHNANNEAKKILQTIHHYQTQIEKIENEHNNLLISMDALQRECEELKEALKLKEPSKDINENDVFYHIRNVVKKKDYYMDELYRSKLDFFHSSNKKKRSYEYEMYKLLLNIIYELRSKDIIDDEGKSIRLSLFAQVRLADIVELQYSSFDNFQKNSYKKDICKMITGIKPDFDNDDYKKTFLYPILSSHIDFLICLNRKTLCEPIVAIELHGEEHNESSDKADKKRIWYDKLKAALFDAKQVNIKLLVANNDELDNADRRSKLKEDIFETLIDCLQKTEGVFQM